MADNLEEQKIIDGLTVSRETIDLLKQYQELIIKWNKKTNLVSKSTIVDLWYRHIVDSLQLIKYIDDQEIHLVDVGSGAGFPGIVMSLAGIKEVTLIEANTKKASFLSYIASVSTNKINVINKRAECVNIDCDIITSRACANIKDTLALTHQYTLRDKYLILKGLTYQHEIDTAQQAWTFDYETYPSLTSIDGVVVKMNKINKLILGF